MKKTPRNGALVLIASIVACIAFVVGILALIFVPLRTNPVYRMGVELAKNDPAVIELLGSPVKDGFFVIGQTHGYFYGDDTANLQGSISGPKRHGLLFVYGQGKGDTWKILSMSIRVDGKLVLTYDTSEQGFQPYKPVP